jgi:Tol biopolymer transport system component
VSPNGQQIAFQAMVDGDTQVAVMNPISGATRVLTSDRSHGALEDLGWSHDGTRIYYARWLDQPYGTYSVTEQGTDERLVLDQAMTPRAVNDGSLLVVKINADRQKQVYRFWPDDGRLTPLGALLKSTLLGFALRVFPDGREAVFFGRPTATPDATDHLYAIDLGSGATRDSHHGSRSQT